MIKITANFPRKACNLGVDSVRLVINQSWLALQPRLARLEYGTHSDELRILIAEDYPQWRMLIRSILQAVPGWAVVFEAADGVTAVQGSAELHPDIAVLDVGLPRLSGIEAAKQIRQHSPDSKIIFVTTETDWDIKESAIEAGADGYVLKRNVNAELVPTIAAALHGEGFGEAYFSPRKVFDNLAVPLKLDVFFNFLLFPGASHLRLSSYEGIPPGEAGQIATLEYGQAVCGTVALTRKPMLVRNVLDVDDEKVRLIQGYGVQVYNCMPLLDGDRLLGTMSFGSRQRADFQEPELRLMQNECAQVAKRLALAMPGEIES